MYNDYRNPYTSWEAFLFDRIVKRYMEKDRYQQLMQVNAYGLGRTWIRDNAQFGCALLIAKDASYRLSMVRYYNDKLTSITRLVQFRDV